MDNNKIEADTRGKMHELRFIQMRKFWSKKKTSSKLELNASRSQASGKD